jgi:hypothetical protein
MKKKKENNDVHLVLSDELPTMNNGDPIGTWYKEINTQRCYIRYPEYWKYIGENKEMPEYNGWVDESWIMDPHSLDIKE